LEEDASPPHVLIEFSRREHSRFKDNTIHLIGLNVDNKTKTIIWSKVEFGSNIKFKKTSECSQKSRIYNEMYLSKMKYRHMFITASKSECMKYFPSLITSSSTPNTEQSGVVVLMASLLKQVSTSNKCWNIQDFSRIKKCKPNIIKTSNHHNSSGYYASFGNKGSFDKATSSSVGQYVTKKSASIKSQCIIIQEAATYEQYVANEISRAINDLNSFIPKIKSIISPVIDTCFELQSSIKDINIKKGYASNDGCWQSSLCVDAVTGQFHNEQDCTYTLISVPRQDTIESNKNSNKYHFLFELTKKKRLNIPLFPGVSFIFSGLFLTHRQHIVQGTIGNQDKFFNVASYGNKRLFNHIKKSFNNNK
jgi:hypothetical protein